MLENRSEEGLEGLVCCLLVAGPGLHGAGERRSTFLLLWQERSLLSPGTHTSALVWTLTSAPEVPFETSHNCSQLIPVWSPGLCPTGHRKFQGNPRPSHPELFPVHFPERPDVPAT